MQKHHWYVAIGGALAALAPLAALVLPVLAPVHGAGIGVAVAGLIDWWHASKQ